MACPLRQLDDMFQEPGFCPRIDYSLVSAVQLAASVLFFISSVVLAWVEWQHKRYATSIFRSAVLFAMSAILMAPVSTGRVIWPEPQLWYWGPSILFCIGIFTEYYATGLYIWEHQLIECLRALRTLAPSKFKVYRSATPWIVLLCALLHAVLLVNLIARLRSCEDAVERESIISRFFGGLCLLFMLFCVIPALIASLEERLEQRALPKGTPASFRNALRHTQRSGQLVLLHTSLLGVLVLGCFLVEDWHKYGGFVYLHVLCIANLIFNTIRQVMLSYRLCELIRGARETKELLARAQEMKVSELMAAGVRALEEAEVSNTAPPVWERGVSWMYLQSFLSSFDIPKEYTTTQVVEHFIKPITESAKCSAWEAALMSESDDVSSLIGRPTIFVSHSWNNNFADLVTILESQCVKQGEAIGSAFFFLDVFCMNQHAIAENSIEDDVGLSLLEELKKAISFPGKMIMVLEPWYQPQSLTRCWCLYELYLASITETQVLMAFSEEYEKRVTQALATNLNLASDIATRVDVRRANATYQRDREMIFAAIQGEGGQGIERFNVLIKEKLSESLYLATLGLMFQSRFSASPEVFDKV